MSKSLLCLFFGTVIGAAGGYMAARIRYKKKFEKDLEAASQEMEAYYRGTDSYARKYREEDQNEEKEPEKLTPEEKKERKAEIKESIKNTEKTEYHKMYEVKDAESYEEKLDEEAMECTKWHDQNKTKSPEIITEDEAEDLPSHVREEPLYYYMGNDVLVDDFDNVVDEPGFLIGDALTKFNFDDPESEQELMYVINYQHDVCYIVQKIEGTFEQD